jgi:hypothetical protein
LFRINIETACFGVSIERKQRKRNPNKEKGTETNKKEPTYTEKKRNFIEKAMLV